LLKVFVLLTKIREGALSRSRVLRENIEFSLISKKLKKIFAKSYPPFSLTRPRLFKPSFKPPLIQAPDRNKTKQTKQDCEEWLNMLQDVGTPRVNPARSGSKPMASHSLAGTNAGNCQRIC
jgi:hypothetical protein